MTDRLDAAPDDMNGKVTPPPFPLPTPVVFDVSNQRKLSFYQQAARASWGAPIIAIALGVTTVTARDPAQPGGKGFGLFVGAVNCVLIVVGFALGITALFGIRKRGARKILWPALIGIALNGAFIASAGLMFIGFSHLRSTGANSSAPLPAVSVMTPQQAQDSLVKSPGWVGRATDGGTVLTVFTIGKDTALGNAVREDLATDDLVLVLIISNSGGTRRVTADPADLSVVLTNGSNIRAVGADKLPRTSRIAKQDLAAAYPCSAVIEAATPAPVTLLLLLPVRVDLAQIDHAIFQRDGNAVVISGRLLTVAEKETAVERWRAAAASSPGSH